MRKRARKTLETLLKTESETIAVQQYLGKLASVLVHWLKFATEPDIEQSNNAAEMVLSEPIVLRKIDGTHRTESDRFFNETLLSFLPTWKQQSHNLFEELKRTARSNSIIY